MFHRKPASLPERVGFFLVPQFAMLSFASALEPLRSANRLSGRALYSWHILSKDGGPVLASNGIPVVPEASIERAPALDALVVCAGIDAHLYEDRAVFAWLRRMARRPIEIGAISLGSYVLARAGLLDGYRCTLHWENLSGFTEAFPELEVTSELFEIDMRLLLGSRSETVELEPTPAVGEQLELTAEETAGPFFRPNSSNMVFAASFGRLDERSRRSQFSEAPMRTLSSERISVCRSSPEEMWITRPVAIRSYKAITSITNRAVFSTRVFYNEVVQSQRSDSGKRCAFCVFCRLTLLRQSC